MKLSEYISEERGRGISIASAINVAPQQVYQWASGSRSVPADHCPAIERATDGAVRCEEMRPDVDWAYLRAAAPQKKNRSHDTPEKIRELEPVEMRVTTPKLMP